MLLVWKNLVTIRANQIRHFSRVTPVMAASHICKICCYLPVYSLMQLFLLHYGFTWEINAPVGFGEGSEGVIPRQMKRFSETPSQVDSGSRSIVVSVLLNYLNLTNPKVELPVPNSFCVKIIFVTPVFEHKSRML